MVPMIRRAGTTSGCNSLGGLMTSIRRNAKTPMHTAKRMNIKSMGTTASGHSSQNPSSSREALLPPTQGVPLIDGILGVPPVAVVEVERLHRRIPAARGAVEADLAVVVGRRRGRVALVEANRTDVAGAGPGCAAEPSPTRGALGALRGYKALRTAALPIRNRDRPACGRAGCLHLQGRGRGQTVEADAQGG
eukprot:7391770-Prymnesium_polylepis.4